MSKKNETYVIATAHSWNIQVARNRMPDWHGNWLLVTQPGDIEYEWLSTQSPKFVFFPHWNLRVPDNIISTMECVCFHMTDLPYGRGGSPLQNLIGRGHTDTKISALKMTTDLDAGPIYMKRDLSLLGTAEEIYLRAANIIMDMIEEIVETVPEPIPQSGDPHYFRRRTPEQSLVPADIDTLDDLFDHIRMLDAEGYPRAFIDCDGYRYELYSPHRRSEYIEARVRITKRDTHSRD